MEHLTERLDRAVDIMSMMERKLPGLTVPAAAIGATEAGLPGRFGREMYAHWVAVLDARAREAAAATARLAEMSASVRTTREQYRTTDETVAARLRREI
ncbi:MAG TPA: hypothetical protein VGB74_20090 [Actinoplanes sp.]|jgi:hypothetical protein